VVISTELISFAPASEKRALLAMIADRKDEVSVIYAFRRPDEYLDSMMNQALKNGRIDRLQAWKQRIDRETYNVPFLQDVREWHDILGPERLRVVYFSKQSYQRYLEKTFAFMGVDLGDPNIDPEVHDNSAMTEVGHLLRKICFARLADRDHVIGRLDRHHVAVQLDALEKSLGISSPKMVMLSSQDRRRVMSSNRDDMLQLSLFLDEEDRAVLEQEMAQNVPDGLVASDPDALLGLPPEAMTRIITGFCQGPLRGLLQY